MRPLHHLLGGGRRAHATDQASDSALPRSRSEVRAPARGPAGMYLALTGGDAEVDESQRTFSRTTLALAAIVLYALATPLFWASAAHAKTPRVAPHATLVSKDHGSDSHDGEHDGNGDGGPDPNAGKGVAGAGNSNTGVSAQSNNAAAPSNSAANANSNTAAQAACPVQPSNTSAAQANSNSNTGAQANSNSGAQANSNTGAQANSNTGAQANSNTGAQANSNTGAQANSNTGAQPEAKAAHAAKAHAVKAHKADAADSNTGVSAASVNSSNTAAGAPGDQTTNAAENCPPPVVTPVITPVITPGDNPQPTQPGGPTPTPGSTPVANSQPASGVAGVVARSARASLRAQTTCGASAARVTMRVLRVRRVVFSVNGRRVRTVDVAANARTVSVALPLRASGPRRQTVTARVTFRNGQPARTLRVRVTRCAAVRPQFTG